MWHRIFQKYPGSEQVIKFCSERKKNSKFGTKWKWSFLQLFSLFRKHPFMYMKPGRKDIDLVLLAGCSQCSAGITIWFFHGREIWEMDRCSDLTWILKIINKIKSEYQLQICTSCFLTETAIFFFFLYFCLENVLFLMCGYWCWAGEWVKTRLGSAERERNESSLHWFNCSFAVNLCQQTELI